MSAPSTDIRDMLITAGVGTAAAVSGWGVYVAEEPASPDTVVTVYDTGGQDSEPNILLDYPSVMVRVRGAPGDYAAAWSKAQAVKDALLGKSAATVNSTRYVGIWIRGDINYLGRDDNRRPQFSLNFATAREPASGTNRT